MNLFLGIIEHVLKWLRRDVLSETLPLLVGRWTSLHENTITQPRGWKSKFSWSWRFLDRETGGSSRWSLPVTCSAYRKSSCKAAFIPQTEVVSRWLVSRDVTYALRKKSPSRRRRWEKFYDHDGIIVLLKFYLFYWDKSDLFYLIFVFLTVLHHWWDYN